MSATLDDLGAQYREAKASVLTHLQRQAAAELEHLAWLKKHRGIPADRLYDRETGDPTDPELAELEARMKQAEFDVSWCRALVVACGEAVKGCPFESVPRDRSVIGRAAERGGE